MEFFVLRYNCYCACYWRGFVSSHVSGVYFVRVGFVWNDKALITDTSVPGHTVRSSSLVCPKNLYNSARRIVYHYCYMAVPGKRVVEGCCFSNVWVKWIWSDRYVCYRRLDGVDDDEYWFYYCWVSILVATLEENVIFAIRQNIACIVGSIGLVGPVESVDSPKMQNPFTVW